MYHYSIKVTEKFFSQCFGSKVFLYQWLFVGWAKYDLTMTGELAILQVSAASENSIKNIVPNSRQKKTLDQIRLNYDARVNHLQVWATSEVIDLNLFCSS